MTPSRVGNLAFFTTGYNYMIQIIPAPVSNSRSFNTGSPQRQTFTLKRQGRVPAPAPPDQGRHRWTAPV